MPQACYDAHMTLNELRYIVAVARERHFGHAAEACFVSQPTLSVAVKKLEDELGLPLFERSKNEVTVTASGEAVIAQAQRVLEQAEQLKQLASQGRDPLNGTLRLGAIYTIAPYVLPQLIPRLRRMAPNMPLLIEENFTAQLTERLKQGDLDVIVISLPYDEAGVRTLPLYEEPFDVLLPAGHAWEALEQIDAKTLAEGNLLLLGAGHCFRDQVLAMCPGCSRSAARGSMQKTLEGGSLETIRHMVASGAGVTVLPRTSIEANRHERNLLVVKPFAAPVPTRRVALAWRTSFPRPQAVQAIAQAVQACKLPGVESLQAPA